MWRVALRMLAADRAKFAGLVFGLAFTSFLVTFAASYFCGFMTNGYALLGENPQVDVWVMDPAVEGAEQTTNLPSSALARVRGVDGVRDARGLRLATLDARFANGRVQPVQVVAVDEITLDGVPTPTGTSPAVLREGDTVLVDAGGTEDKLLAPANAADSWPHDGAHLDAPMRLLAAGDELLLNDRAVQVRGVTAAHPRFPPRPLVYMARGTALRVVPYERRDVTFVLVRAMPGVAADVLAARIAARTGLRARASADFVEDTVRWYLVNSEDVGDISAMLVLAMTMGLGVSGIMLYLFTHDRRRDYAVLRAMGLAPRTLSAMVTVQALTAAAIGAGLGLGLCAIAGEVVRGMGFPFRMLVYTPVVGLAAVLLVAVAGTLASLVPVRRLQPAEVFALR
jgi:putative ABC transport system permease protein